MADDSDTALLYLAAFSLTHRLNNSVGSPADAVNAVDDGCEVPVLTAASCCTKLIMASTAFLSLPSNDNSLNINSIGLSWRGSLITLLRLQLMVCFTHISCKNRNWEKPKPRLSVRNRPKLNWKWNSRTVTALLASQHSSQSCSISGEI